MCSRKLRKEKIDYTTYIDNEKCKIQNISANLCENCGEAYFDTKTAMEIEETIESIKIETNDQSIEDDSLRADSFAVISIMSEDRYSSDLTEKYVRREIVAFNNL